MPEDNREYRGAGLLSAVAPVMVLTLVFVIAGISPLGGRLLLSPANADWFDRLCTFRRVLSGGTQDNLFYSLSEGLGADFYRSFAGGLCSPFVLLTGIFPETVMAEALSFVSMARACCTGFFSYLMLSQLCVNEDGSPNNRLGAAIFAVGYASGSSMLLTLFAPEYADAAVFLPLVGAGIGLLCSRGSVMVLLTGMSLFLLCTPALWPVLVAFCVIWYCWCQSIYSPIPQPAPLRRSGAGNLGLLLLCMAIAFGTAAVVMVPYLSAGDEAGGILCTPAEVDVTSLPALLAGMLPGARLSAEGGSGLIPMAFCSTLAPMMLFIYFFDSRRGLLERQIPVFGSAAIILCMLVPALGWLFAGFARPTGQVVACGFLLSALTAGAAARLLSSTAQPDLRLPVWLDAERLERLYRRRGRSGAGVMSVLLAWLAVMLLTIAGSIFNDGFTVGTVMVTSVFVTGFAAFAIAALSGSGKRVGACMLLLLLVCGECIYAGAATLSEQNAPLYSSSQYTLDYNKDNNFIAHMNQEGFFRIRGGNVAQYNRADAPGEMPEATAQLLEVLGIRNGRGWTPVTDALFGVRYVFGEAPQGPYTQLGDGQNTVLWQADHAMPLAYAVSSEMLNLNSYSSNPFTAQNQFITAAAGIQREPFAEAAILERLPAGCYINDGEGGMEIIRNESDASVVFNVAAPVDGALYMCLDDKEMHKESITVGGRELGECTLGEVIFLGSFSRGTTVNVTVSVSTDRLRLEGAYFAQLDRIYSDAALEELCQRQGNKSSAARSGSLGAALTLEEGQIVLFTVPWQNGWTAKVDGEESDVLCAAGALIAVAPGSGAHTIQLVYTPPSFGSSVVISIASILTGLIFACAAEAIRRKREMAVMARLAPRPQSYDRLPEPLPLSPQPAEYDYTLPPEPTPEEQKEQEAISELMGGIAYKYDEYGYGSSSDDFFD
ncbi:MAG: hypothetical protein E7559_02295 [Ruminococcaceae bacterium]|nr:hypothetical protein [Oscillospiraceae bacterium]